MSYEEALKALEERQEQRIELGLERVREHLERLGRPDRAFRSLHVAGTNGKGSVCAILESVLRASGRRVGLYTSPHLREVRERIRVGGEDIPREAFARLLARALEADPGSRLTYFELLTSVAFQWFAESACDAAVLETGLGGRLDATNVVESPAACAIVSIGLDHQQWLGDTIEKIAEEKAGIAKAGRPLIVGALPPEARAVVERVGREAGAKLIEAGPPQECVAVDWPGGRQRLRGPVGEAWLSLLGSRQGENVALVRTMLAAAELPVSPRAWQEGLAGVRWPARFEVRSLGDLTLIFDGAHNEPAARALADTFARSPWAAKRVVWIIGMMKDKDAGAVLGVLAPHLKQVIALRGPGLRAMEAGALAEAVRRAAPAAKVLVAADAAAALHAFRWETVANAAVVCGSFYVVGSVLEVLDHAALEK